MTSTESSINGDAVAVAVANSSRSASNSGNKNDNNKRKFTTQTLLSKEEVDDSNESSRSICDDKGTSNISKKNRRRIICDRCSRPKPQTCICSALPTNPVLLKKVEIIILQHPLELKNHKSTANRSVPLLELCLHSSCLHLLHGRRFGKESLGKELTQKLHGPGHGGNDSDGDADLNFEYDYIPVLVFPKLKKETIQIISSNSTSSSTVPVPVPALEQQTESDMNNEKNKDEQDQQNRKSYREEDATVLSLNGLLRKMKEEDSEDADKNKKNIRKKKKKKILLLVLDATWNHAREMHMANIRLHQYPINMLRLALEKEDLIIDNNNSNSNSNGKNGKEFQPGRFRLRGKISKKGYKKKSKSGSSNNSKSKKHEDDEDEEPLDGSWMSTAECIAWIVSKIEEQESEQQHNKHNEHKHKHKQVDEQVDDGKQQTKSSSSTIVVDDASSGTATTMTTCTSTSDESSSSSSSLSLYEILMKPLDLMVLKWKSFVDNSSNNNNHHKYDR